MEAMVPGVITAAVQSHAEEEQKRKRGHATTQSQLTVAKIAQISALLRRVRHVTYINAQV